MQFTFGSTLIGYLILVAILVVLAIAIFNYRNPTEEQKEANRNRLYVGIGLGVLVLTGGLLVLNSGLDISTFTEGKKSESDKKKSSGEYGFREAFAEWREQKKAAADARREGKRAGMSREEIEANVRNAKKDYREVKIAGQEAKLKAREAQRNLQQARNNKM